MERMPGRDLANERPRVGRSRLQRQQLEAIRAVPPPEPGSERAADPAVAIEEDEEALSHAANGTRDPLTAPG